MSKHKVIKSNQKNDKKIKQDINDLDQFYTNPIVASGIIKRLFKLFPSLKNCFFIEPSAGTGNFIVALKENKILKNNIIGYDLDPKSKNIIKKDYLKTQINYDEKLVIIGNPPFGKRGEKAIYFLNKALTESDFVVFILPNIFNRYLVQKKIKKESMLIYSETLSEDIFLLNNKTYKVKCQLQIWINPNYKTYLKNKRITNPLPTKSNYFKTWIHNNTPETLKYFDKNKYKWDFAVVRQGFYNYEEKITDPKKLIKNRQYFFVKYISLDSENIIKNINFSKLSKKNTQVNGFSTTDFLLEYKRVKELLCYQKYLKI